MGTERTGLASAYGLCHHGIPKGSRDLRGEPLRKLLIEGRAFLAEFGLGGEGSSPGVSSVTASPDPLLPFSVQCHPLGPTSS